MAYHRRNLLRGLLCFMAGLVLIGGFSQIGMQLALEFDTSARGDNFRHWLERSDREQVEYVTLGSSHSLAIDIDTLPGPSQHLFLPLADFHETRAVARTMLRDAMKLKMVLVPVSPVHPYQNNSVHFPPSRLANYGITSMHSITLIDGDLRGWFMARHEGLRALARIPNWLGCLLLKSETCFQQQDRNIMAALPDNFPDIKAKQFLDFIGAEVPASANVTDQIDALYAMAADLSARDIKLVLYPSPLSSKLVEAMERGFHKRGWTGQNYPLPDIDAARKIIMDRAPPDFCLYWVDGLWNASDASTGKYYRPNDVDHLSPEGARIFTSRLVEQLAKLENCSKSPR